MYIELMPNFKKQDQNLDENKLKLWTHLIKKIIKKDGYAVNEPLFRMTNQFRS